MTFTVKNPNPYYCAASVHDIFGASFHQCGNKPRPNSELCGTHSPEAEARREAKSAAGYQAWKDKVMAPSRRIEQLEAINADLLVALKKIANPEEPAGCSCYTDSGWRVQQCDAHDPGSIAQTAITKAKE